MTKSKNPEDKLLAFSITLGNTSRSLKASIPQNSPFHGAKQHLPRIISNSLFDNTSREEYCIQKVYHKDGKFLKKENNKRRIKDLKPIISKLKKDIRHFGAKYQKGKYNDLVETNKKQLLEFENELKSCKKEDRQMGQIGFMKEHPEGREQSSKCILEYVTEENKIDFPFMREVEDILIEDPEFQFDEDTSTKIRGILNQVKPVLKRFSFTIWLEKIGTIHTQANEKLESIQDGNATWQNYQDIITELGYLDLLEETKPFFDAGKINLKYL